MSSYSSCPCPVEGWQSEPPYAPGVLAAVELPYSLAEPDGRCKVKGILDDTLPYNGSAVLSIWEFNGISEVDTGENIVVYGWLMCTDDEYHEGEYVTAFYDRNSARWYVDGNKYCPTVRPPCTGTCEWLWYPNDCAWGFLRGSCSFGCGCLYPTFCGASDDYCLTTVTTCEHPPGNDPPNCYGCGPDGSYTTGTTSTTTTANPCIGSCLWDWHITDGGYWEQTAWGCLGGLGGCDCPPPVNAGVSDCEVAQTLCCEGCYTSSTTTSTTSTTSTTTTAEPYYLCTVLEEDIYCNNPLANFACYSSLDHFPNRIPCKSYLTLVDCLTGCGNDTSTTNTTPTTTTVTTTTGTTPQPEYICQALLSEGGCADYWYNMPVSMWCSTYLAAGYEPCAYYNSLFQCTVECLNNWTGTTPTTPGLTTMAPPPPP